MADSYRLAGKALRAGATAQGIWEPHDYVAVAQVYATLALVDAVRTLQPNSPMPSVLSNIAEIQRIANVAREREQEILAGCTCAPSTGPQDDCPVHNGDGDG